MITVDDESPSLPAEPGLEQARDLLLGVLEDLPDDIREPLPDWMEEANFPWIAGVIAGRGGSGIVWQAKHRKTGEEAALKVIFFRENSEVARERWVREARVARELSHPSLLDLRESGLSPDGEAAWLALEWIKGQSLRNLLQREGKLPWRLVLEIARQACAGLTVMHGAKLIHRDIKPSNLMLEEDSGRLVISDFGVALALNEERVTRTSEAVLSRGYAPPEQSTPGQVPDGRSDQFSLAVTLWECLAGEVPAGAFTRLRSDAPQWANQVLRRALAPDPAQRYPTIEDFFQDLEGKTIRRRRVLAAFGAIALAGAASVVLWNPNEPPKDEPKTTSRALFFQDFENSNQVSDYVGQGANQMSDISAEDDGGSWSIDKGGLKIRRIAANSKTNDAGFDFALEGVKDLTLVKFSWDLVMSELPSSSRDCFFIDLGSWETDFLDYSSRGPHRERFLSLEVKSTKTREMILRFENANSRRQLPVTEGQTRHFTWLVNKSDTPESYTAPDGNLRELSPRKTVLWVDEQLVLSQGISKISSRQQRLNRVRVRFSNVDPMVVIFDNLSLEDSLR